jgi:hypothetical protein
MRRESLIFVSKKFQINFLKKLDLNLFLSSMDVIAFILKESESDVSSTALRKGTL